MTYEMYRYIFMGGAILSVLMLLVSVLLFVVLKIPKVIGDLNGSNARRAIAMIREQNTSTGEKTFKSSSVNRERGRLTDKISQSGRLEQNPASDAGAMRTSKISTAELDGAGETTMLEPVGEETTLLSSAQDMVFEIEFDITYIHSDEIIENGRY